MSATGLIAAALRLYAFVVLARVIFSWLPHEHRRSELYAFVFRATEPVLAPVRKILPPMGGFDFSPLLVVILLDVIARNLRGL